MLAAGCGSSLSIMTMTTATVAHEPLAVVLDGVTFPAEPVARGAAFEIFAMVPLDGFVRNPRAGTLLPYRRFVHATDVDIVAGETTEPTDTPLSMPLRRTISWATVYRLSQSAPAAASPLLAGIRDTATIQRGTRMVKVLSGRQLAGHLRGRLPYGFCHREYDIAHLRTPAALAVLRSDGSEDVDADVVFGLRWRAVDPADYAVPSQRTYDGLVRIPPHDRLGAPVLGTGFAPSRAHIIPEWITADLVDLPLPARAELIAFTPDGSEVLLYRYLAEQRAWARMAGPQWRHLLDGLDGIAADQEYFPVEEPLTRLVGMFREAEYEAIADPPDEFWLLAKVRALRHPMTSPARRTPLVSWRGETCAVVRDNGDWLRVRMMRPHPEALVRLGATCIERGVYEAWAPTAEVDGRGDLVVRYPQR
jgi:hypothetical protein